MVFKQIMVNNYHVLFNPTKTCTNVYPTWLHEIDLTVLLINNQNYRLEVDVIACFSNWLTDLTTATTGPFLNQLHGMYCLYCILTQ